MSNQDQTETVFKVKKTTKMQKIYDAYIQRKNLSAATVRFVVDGTCVR
jgi:small ubiquitin-related modifier